LKRDDDAAERQAHAKDDGPDRERNLSIAGLDDVGQARQ
jgi:hypothetical protein